jgi:hypothetical protein
MTIENTIRYFRHFQHRRLETYVAKLGCLLKQGKVDEAQWLVLAFQVMLKLEHEIDGVPGILGKGDTMT